MKPIPLAASTHEREERWRNLLRVVSLVTAMFAATLTFYVGFKKSIGIDAPGLQQTSNASEVRKELTLEIEGLRAQIKTLTQDTQKLVQLPPDAKLAIQLTQLQDSVRLLSERLEKIEAAILANPAKALEIPLLQRDVENLRSTQQSNLVAVKEGVDRLYDINKWLLGAMAVSVITLALSNFLRPKESAPKNEA